MDNTTVFFLIYQLSHQSPLLDKLMIVGSQYVIAVVFFLLIFLPFIGSHKERKAFVLTILTLIISFIMINIIKLFYFEPRPFMSFHFIPLIKHLADSAFPSTHTTIVASIAFPFLFYKSRYSPLLLLLVLWIGFARIFVGVHYPLDILGGILVGLTATFLAWELKIFLKHLLFQV